MTTQIIMQSRGERVSFLEKEIIIYVFWNSETQRLNLLYMQSF